MIFEVIYLYINICKMILFIFNNNFIYLKFFFIYLKFFFIFNIFIKVN